VDKGGLGMSVRRPLSAAGVTLITWHDEAVNAIARRPRPNTRGPASDLNRNTGHIMTTTVTAAPPRELSSAELDLVSGARPFGDCTEGGVNLGFVYVKVITCPEGSLLTIGTPLFGGHSVGVPL
jgi:hypothetical protein